MSERCCDDCIKNLTKMKKNNQMQVTVKMKYLMIIHYIWL